MVYRGKPSAACQMCRSRRIKCDLKRPACTQCTNRSMSCPGYRSQIDIYFKNENDATARKVNRKSRSPKDLTLPSPVSDHSSPELQTEQLLKFITKNAGLRNIDFNPTDPSTYFPWLDLQQPMEDVGVSFFMSSYVPGSHFEYLSTLYNSTGVESPLYTVLYAASLASLSQELNDSSLMESARISYANGLAMTNTALADPVTAVLDSTLASVLLLSLFEAMVWEGISTSDNWTAHTLGAIALLKVRGEKQFQTDIGRRMFMQVSNSMRISCLQRRVDTPPDMGELLQKARPWFTEYNPKFELATLTSELTVLLARGERTKFHPDVVVDAVQQLDTKFVQAMQRLPPKWQYTQECVSDEQARRLQAYGFGPMVHLYPDHHVAQLWNSYRMIRLLLNTIVHLAAEDMTAAAYLHPGSPPNPRIDKLLHLAASNCEEMADDICASVHQFIPSSFASTGACSLTLSTNLPSRACAASFLWPLSAIRSVACIPRAKAQYASEKLRDLGIGLKIKQAVRVSGIAYDLDALGDGLHMFYLT